MVNTYLALRSQINFAGEGGLYAEMIQDRSFDAMALALGFAPGNATVPLRPSDETGDRSGSHHLSRRLAAAERLPWRSGAVASLASMFSMPLPLSYGQREGACAMRGCCALESNALELRSPPFAL